MQAPHRMYSRFILSMILSLKIIFNRSISTPRCITRNRSNRWVRAIRWLWPVFPKSDPFWICRRTMHHWRKHFERSASISRGHRTRISIKSQTMIERSVKAWKMITSLFPSNESQRWRWNEPCHSVVPWAHSEIKCMEPMPSSIARRTFLENYPTSKTRFNSNPSEVNDRYPHHIPLISRTVIPIIVIGVRSHRCSFENWTGMLPGLIPFCMLKKIEASMSLMISFAVTHPIFWHEIPFTVSVMIEAFVWYSFLARLISSSFC